MAQLPRRAARGIKTRLADAVAVRNGRTPPGQPQRWRLTPQEFDAASPILQERLDAVAQLADLVAAHRDEFEVERRLPDAVGAALHAAEFAKMQLPARFGGDELPLIAGAQVVEELARLDGSVGWNAWVLIGHARVSEHMSVEAARTVFMSSDNKAIAGSLTPTGRARREKGGYRLSGRWAFGSALSLADYIQTGAIAFDHDRPICRSDGSQLQLGLIVPTESCTILDTWHTTGLRGTGSHDIVVDDVFVDDTFAFDERRVWTPLPPDPDVTYGRPYDEFSPPLMAAVAVGVARDALETFTAYARSKSAAGHFDWVNRLPVTHDVMGRAEIRIVAARASLYSTIRSLDAVDRGAPSLGAATKAACAHVVQECIAAVDLLYEAGGGSSIYAKSRLERCFRDVHMISHHALIAQRTFADVGWLALSAP